jgi:heat shock protein HtpX
MRLWKLYLSMIGTLAFIIGFSTLAFAIILSVIGLFSWLTIGTFVVIFNVIQWLIAPYLIEMFYHVRGASPKEARELHRVFDVLAKKSGIRKPKLMIADIPLPNAFAYGSPLTGSRVAVTKGLLRTLEMEEVEAVLGHELGHLRHRDVQLMMFVSILPAIFYWIGYSLYFSSFYRAREERGGGLMAIGVLCILIHYLLMLLILHLSRTREYYADRYSVDIVDDGARKLSEGLAKIVAWSGRMKGIRPEAISGLSHFKTLFIADPDRAEVEAAVLMKERIVTRDEELVRKVLERELTIWDRIGELFSTHPNIVKRLRALRELA